MILAVDIGNTSIVLGGFEQNDLQFVSRLSSNLHTTQDEYAMLISGALALHSVDKSRIDGTIIASVVPPLNDEIKKALLFLFGKEPLMIGPGIKSGISIRCDMPSSVGADLIATAVAAHYLYESPALVIDMGTATKISVVDQQGAFIGASIIPGVTMGLNALAEQTAQLPKISLKTPDKVIAKNTVDCMRSGVLYGHASMIDGMIDRIRQEFGKDLFILATGGMASTVIPLCRHEIHVDEALVLKGLHILYQKNHI